MWFACVGSVFWRGVGYGGMELFTGYIQRRIVDFLILRIFARLYIDDFVIEISFYIFFIDNHYHLDL